MGQRQFRSIQSVRKANESLLATENTFHKNETAKESLQRGSGVTSGDTQDETGFSEVLPGTEAPNA